MSNVLFEKESSLQNKKKDVCFHVSDGVQTIVPPQIIEKILLILSNYFQDNYKAIFISPTNKRIYKEKNFLYLPSEIVDRLFFCSIIATRISLENISHEIINLRLTIEE